MATVLVVDDEPAILEVVAEFARMLGHEVLTAVDGVEALLVVDERRPDVIVSDVMMPRMSGPALRAALLGRPALATVPIVFMTAVHKPPLADGTPYIKKPFDLEELERALDEALAKSLSPRPSPERDLAGELEHARALLGRLKHGDPDRSALDDLDRLLEGLASRVRR